MKNFLRENKFYVWIFIVILFLILWRFYYSFIVYNYTFSSWDATGYVLRALYFQQWFFDNWLDMLKSNVSDELFSTPFFIPYILAFFSLFLWVDLYNISFLISSLITTVGIIFLYYYLYKSHWFLITFLTTLLISVNSYISFYSTEPLKAPYIVSFFIISIYYLTKIWSKNLFISLFFIGLTIFVHLTWIFFILSYIIIYLLINKKELKNYYNPVFISWIIYILFFIFTYKWLNVFFSFDINEKLGLEQWYWFASWEFLAFWSNIKNWWWNFWFLNFINWIEGQVWTIIFLSSFIWILISVFYKKYRNIFLLITILLVFTWFSLKWVASSHWSRYPYYVNWLFIYYFVIFIIFIFDKLKNKIFKIIFIIFIIITIFINTWFFNNYAAWYRHQYKANKEIWIYIWKNINIDKDNKLLYMWWPSTTYWILKFNWIYNKDNIIRYWWLTQENLNLMNIDFIRNNKIKYFLYEKTWSDYLKSFDFLQIQLEKNIEKIYEIKDGSNRKVILYKVID